MGYRERKALKQQQKQQSLGQSVQSERILPLPMPITMNTRDHPDSLPPGHATLVENIIFDDGGPRVVQQPAPVAYLTSTTADQQVLGLVYYTGSGSASAEMWAMATNKIHNVGDVIDGGTLASTSTVSLTNGGFYATDWIEFNKTIITVAGNGQWANKWTRATGWELWSATASGGAIGLMTGINSFKSRLYAWEYRSSKFWYGSVEQTLGTLKPFDLGTVIGENIKFMANMTRDGGDGPDDFAVFVGESGKTAVYQGSNPADASDWGLVGVYKIGQPVGKNAHVTYGQQLVVLCEDDFYFLPADLQGKRAGSVASENRLQNLEAYDSINAINAQEDGYLLFSDGSLLSTKSELAYSTVTLIEGVSPDSLRKSQQFFKKDGDHDYYYRPSLARYKDKTYVCTPRSSASSASLVVHEVFPNRFGSANYKARLNMPIPGTTGRTSISLINPVMGFRPGVSVSVTASGSADPFMVYRAAIVYDRPRLRYATASSELFTTSTASVQNDGLWTPGYGTGRSPQVHLQILTASAENNNDLFIYRIDATATDTGGL